MWTITVWHECATWWRAARDAVARGDYPAACIGLIDEVTILTVEECDADEFIAWAERLPGWSEQPFLISFV